VEQAVEKRQKLPSAPLVKGLMNAAKSNAHVLVMSWVVYYSLSLSSSYVVVVGRRRDAWSSRARRRTNERT